MKGAKPRHGHNVRGKRSPTYNSWTAMKARCLNSNNHAYHHYGGRGIQVCQRWLTFDNFLADMGKRPEGTTLGRHGDAGNYEPGNCSWQTHKEQGIPRDRHYKTKLTEEQLACAASLWIPGNGNDKRTRNGPTVSNMARDLGVNQSTLREAIKGYFAACDTAVA